MPPPTPVPALEVRASPRHGRGVFCVSGAAAGTVLERCPVILLPNEQLPHLDQTALYGYYYAWDDTSAALALGFGSLYNHDADPSADYYSDHDGEVIEVVARRDLAPGEEVTIDYTGGGSVELWFDPV